MVFNIRVKMQARWVPHFLAMLDYMAVLGRLGGSRRVCFYADGDGDFRPEFTWDVDVPLAAPVRDEDGDRLYDAG
jgi:hypothetical protein